VLETAIRKPALSEHLVTIFNDSNAKHIARLNAAVGRLPGIESLRREPIIHNCSANSRVLTQFLDEADGPTLSFVDPFGYKDLSLDLIDRVTRGFGCDCIFFLNYRRINPALNNPAFDDNLNILFGRDRANSLRVKLAPLTPDEREVTVIEELVSAIQGMFCFTRNHTSRSPELVTN
jgi:three-Cys-motif partner protein